MGPEMSSICSCTSPFTYMAQVSDYVMKIQDCIFAIIVQGGAVNHRLFFAGPPPLPLGAVSGKISKK
jgi:hypothetical protein